MPDDPRARLIAYLCQAGLSAARANAVLDDFTHELAEKIRRHRNPGHDHTSCVPCFMYGIAAEVIDPEAA